MKRSLVLVAALLALTVAAGCGGSSSSGSSGTSPTSAAPNSEGSKSADQILADARAAATSAQAVRISGTATDAGGPGTLDLRLTDSGGAGSVSSNGTQVKVVRIGGTTYLTGGESFWHEIVPSAAAAKLLTTKWLKVPSDSPGYKSLAKIVDKTSVLRTQLTPQGTVSRGSVTTYKGQPVIELKDSKGGSLFVAATGTPYPVAIVGDGTHKGTVVFSGWNQPVTLTAPAGAIDQQQLHDLTNQ